MPDAVRCRFQLKDDGMEFVTTGIILLCSGFMFRCEWSFNGVAGCFFSII
ncbi:hypothetical protein [Chlorobium phaeobacteroides]|nr:hypothetical protein [Chlorobium phaeobacteroides]